MKKSTIRNIIFAMLGAFLFGLSIDIASWTIGIMGSMLIVIAMWLAIAEES